MTVELVETEAQYLRRKLREAYEGWVGSELPAKPVAETAAEAYAYWVLDQVLRPIVEALEGS